MRYAPFRVFLYHVHVGSAELARARIATRVDQGGHDVPGDKVEASYEGTLRLIPRAASIAAITLVFDNSGIAGTTHRNLMTMRSGRIVTLREPLPEWAEVAYRDALSAHRDEPP